MSRDDEIQRSLGRGMPTPARDYATERYSIKHTDHTPKEPKSPLYMIVDGILLVQEEDGSFRSATAEEYAEIMGDVICWPEFVGPRTNLETAIDDAWTRWANQIIDDYEAEHGKWAGKVP